MSTSTAPRFTVRLDSIAGLAAAISEQLLQVRRIFLHRRAPKDARVHQIHRNIACGRANPLFLLLACSFADLEDGASIGAVTRPYESAIAALQERYQERAMRSPAGPVPLFAVMRQETRAQAQLDDAQLRVLENPDSAEALEAVDCASTVYEESLRRVQAAIRAQRARLALGAVHLGRTVQ